MTDSIKENKKLKEQIAEYELKDMVLSANVIGECWGFNMTKVLAVPVKAMVVYDKFFENVLSLCQKGKYHGPITFVNSNEIARCF